MQSIKGITAVLFTALKWCEPCQQMEKHWLNFQKANPKLPTKVSNEEGKATKLAKRYEVEMCPTVLFLDDKGAKLVEVSGYATQLMLTRALERAVMKRISAKWVKAVKGGVPPRGVARRCRKGTA